MESVGRLPIALSPRLLIESSVDFPPLEFCFGTRPNHAANCRPLLKLFASATDATNALALNGPMRGIFSGLRLSSLSRCQVSVPARGRVQDRMNDVTEFLDRVLFLHDGMHAKPRGCGT